MTEDELRSAIGSLVASSAHKANATDLIAGGHWRVTPSEVTVNAYDGGISLHWRAYEIADFDDRYETYQFAEGDTQIHHRTHDPGCPLNAEMCIEIRRSTGIDAV